MLPERQDTGSLKWDFLKNRFGSEDLLPMWVADMDFPSPPSVIDALVRRAGHGFFGYSIFPPSYYRVIVDWMKRRHQWEIREDWIAFSPGIVPAICMIVQAFSSPGDKVIVQRPVYYPFMAAVKNNGRTVLNNPLSLEHGRYHMDFKDLEAKARDPRARMLILCNPHNPVGRVWSREEQERLGEICLQNNILVISDEIHADLIFEGNQHIPFGSIRDDFLENSITCTAPSKTFNLAGLQTSNLVIAQPGLRRRYLNQLENNGISGPNAFGAAAVEAAYTHGEPWLDALMEYLQGNLKYLRDFSKEYLPGLEIIEPEATYLVWLDFRKFGLDEPKLDDWVRGKAGLALDEGIIFGNPEGVGFERMNIACPRSLLIEALDRLAEAWPELLRMSSV